MKLLWVVVLVSVTVVGPLWADVDLIPSGSQWRYTFQDYVPDECVGPELDDHAWKTGRAPFSSVEEGDFGYRTRWPEGTSLWLRRDVYTAAGSHLYMLIGADDAGDVYWNGVQVASHVGGGAIRWVRTVSIPPSLVLAGRNVVAVRAVDSGGMSAFDARLVTTNPESALADPWAHWSGEASAPGPSRGRYIAAGDLWMYRAGSAPVAECVGQTTNPAGWRRGRAPFGNIAKGDMRAATAWAGNGTIWLRKTFTLGAPRDLRAYVGADNGFEMYLNGELVRKEWTAPAYRWGSVFDIPARLVRPGANVLAVRVVDQGAACGFDMKLEDSPGLARTAYTLYNSANGHYYMGMDAGAGISWMDAKRAAESSTFLWMKGHLATLESAQEQDFLVKNMDRLPKSGSWWLGGYQTVGSPEPAGGWYWVTGKPFAFSAWGESEPSNGEQMEDALELTPRGVWNDRRMGEVSPRIGYIVEFEPTH